VLFPGAIAANAFKTLPLDVEHFTHLLRLPWHHRDPFDRMLVAQACVEDLVLLTSDKSFSDYSVPLLW